MAAAGAGGERAGLDLAFRQERLPTVEGVATGIFSSRALKLVPCGACWRRGCAQSLPDEGDSCSRVLSRTLHIAITFLFLFGPRHGRVTSVHSPSRMHALNSGAGTAD